MQTTTLRNQRSPSVAADTVVPTGRRYEVESPDTLDLAERAAFGLNALTGVLDPAFKYEQYFHILLGANPSYLLHDTTGRPTNDPKYLESLPYMRLMTGSDLRTEAEAGLMAGVLEDTAEDGLFYSRRTKERTWHEACGHVFKDGDRVRLMNEDFCNPYGNARLMIAMHAWHQRDGDPKWIERMERIAAGLSRIAIHKNGYAYFPESRVGEAFSYPKSGWKTTDEPAGQDVGEVADSNIFMYHGGPIRALSLLYAVHRDPGVIAFARELANFCLREKFWGVPGEPAILQGAAHAHWRSHVPGHMSVLRGLLDLANVTQDVRLMDFCRRGYEYGRNYMPMDIGYHVLGIGVRCGCSIPRTMALAIALTDLGLGDYWEDVDRYIRNHATVTQLTDREAIRAYADAAPRHDLNAPMENGDRVIDRAMGSFIAFTNVTNTSAALKAGGCCNSNGTQGLYYAWEAITRRAGDTGIVNLLLSRASPWIDIDSYLPYEGKVVIRNKGCRRLVVRIPLWVPKAEVEAAVDGKPVVCHWSGRYLNIDEASEEAEVTIRFPVEERVEEHRFVEEVGGKADMFQDVETIDGDVIRRHYRCVFKGNTLVAVSPRSDGKALPLYTRDHMRRDKAPMKRVTRFVAPCTYKWHS